MTTTELFTLCDKVRLDSSQSQSRLSPFLWLTEKISFFFLAAKFRCNVSSKSLKESHHILKGKLSKRHLSKSASELRHREEAKSFQQPSVDYDQVRAAKITTPVQQQDTLARHATVVQKTQAFFTSLKVRRRGNRFISFFDFSKCHFSYTFFL